MDPSPQKTKNGAKEASPPDPDVSDDVILNCADLVKTRKGGVGYRLLVESMTIGRGEHLALIGDSGSGKSTLLDMIAMVLKPDSAGDFSFRPIGHAKWHDLWKIWRKGAYGIFEALRRSELGYIMQTGGLLPFLNVADNITLPADLKPGFPKAEKRERFKALTATLGISHLLGKLPSAISVGERQRCAIARALIHAPSLVLADEPTASLDPPTADRVFELLLDLCRDSALVVSTHEQNRVLTGRFKVWRIDCRPGGEGQPIEARVAPLKDRAPAAALPAGRVSLAKSLSDSVH
ncbi:MAG: ATP-binding cassette domain-containing protein [Deltaproteobacteria bacterium]|jgi:putative ABC transport system ATP-binding protein|nr:ATP-binding cassette domain-containing protein [Deltaproteobacteria bacterium]